MNIQTPSPAAGHSVDLSRGSIRTDLNKQWMARPADQRFLNLTDLRNSVRARADNSAENRIDTKKIEFISPEPVRKEDIHDLSIGLPTGEEIAPTHWSFGQLASLAKAPSGYLRTLPSQISADALTFGLRYARNTELIKTYHSEGQLLAATGPDYGRIYDHDVVSAVQEFAGNGDGDTRWKVPGEFDWMTRRYDADAPITIDSTTLYASDRDIFMFLVDDKNPIEVGRLSNGDPDLIFRGFYVSNSEMGSSSLRLAAFYLRGVCQNRLMIGVDGFEEVRIIHSKSAPSRFIQQARPAIQSFADGSVSRLTAGIANAKAAVVAQNDDEMVDFLASRVSSRRRAIDMLAKHEVEEGFPARSVWDAAQAITATARDNLYQNERIEAERVAGAMLNKAAA